MSAATALKAATRRLVAACGGQESAVLIEGMPITRHQTFSEAGLVSQPDKFLRIDVTALLEADCGTPFVTRELAKLSGHELVRLPASLRGNAPLARATGAAMREVGQVFDRLGQALDDGKLTSAEDRDVEGEIDEAIGKLLELKFQVRAEVHR